MPASKHVLLGIDIGGTKVAAGLVSPQGKILTRARVPMPAHGSASSALAAVREAAQLALAAQPAATLAGIGISSPGPLDPRRGVILNPPNLPYWRNYPLINHLAKTFAVPLRLDNDANAAALAEARWGAGKKFSSVFYATFGTGIGSGLILDGKIYHGRTGAAVEGGHVSIDRNGPLCGCGKRGCIEAFASGPALARRARAASAEAVVASRTPRQRAALEETAELIGFWLANIVDLLEPDVIIFGGGMGAVWIARLPLIRKQLVAASIIQRASEIPVHLARYGPDSGIAGAAALLLPTAK